MSNIVLMKAVTGFDTHPNWKGGLSGSIQFKIIKKYKEPKLWMDKVEHTAEYLWEIFGPGYYILKFQDIIIFEGEV